MGVSETDSVGDTEGEREPELVTDAHGDTVPDREPDKNAVAQEEGDTAGVRKADGEGVDPAGAQNGPMLKVGSCVPAMDAAGDDDAAEGDAEYDTAECDTNGLGDMLLESVPVCDALMVTTCGS